MRAAKWVALRASNEGPHEVYYFFLGLLVESSYYCFHIYIYHSVLIDSMKAVVVTFNKDKALVGAFSVITNLCMDLRVKL